MKKTQKFNTRPAVAMSLPLPMSKVTTSPGTHWGENLSRDDLADDSVKDGSMAWKVISLFSGCGGMDLGFRGGFDFLGSHYAKNPFETIWANEINSSACRTYQRNIGERVINGDIAYAIDLLPSSADVIIGGFPCQDISINGKMEGIKGKRSSLYTYMVEAVRRSSPKIFIAENVGSLLMRQHKASLEKILADFRALDYAVTYKLYDTSQYGVPQTRSRVFIIGTRKGLPEFAPPPPARRAPISARQAIGDLENIGFDKTISHIWSLANASKEQGNRKLIADRPGYTIRAECHGNIHFHYSLPRRISMREAARIQSFPDTFIFPCGLRETERQIGNAVPPVMAWHIAQSVKAVLEGA